jgi:hypothetical protein
MSTLTDALKELTGALETTDGTADRLDALETRLAEIEEKGVGTGQPAEPEYPELDLGEDTERQTHLGNQAGIRFKAETDLSGITARISTRTMGVSRAYLKEAGGGEVLEEIDITRYRGGEWITFRTTLMEGEEYEVVLDAEGANFARGRREMDYPVQSDELTVNYGVFGSDGPTSETYRYCLDRLRPGANAGRGFRNGERAIDTLDDVPESAELVYADAEAEINLERDVGAQLANYIDDQGTVNHAIVLPEGTYDWGHRLRVPSSAEYIGLIGEGEGPRYEIREFIDQPLTIGGTRNGVGEALVRNIDWDIDGEDDDGNNIDTGFLEVFAEDSLLVEHCRRLGKRQRYQWFDGNGSHHGWYHVGNAYGMHAAITDSDGVGVVRNCRTDGGVHNPVAEKAGRPGGEGVGFSAEANRGTIFWRGNTARKAVGNTFYMHSGASVEGRNIVEYNQIFNGSRSAIRLGEGDRASDNYIEFSDMAGRHAGSGLWYNFDTPGCRDLEIHAPDGNHELVRMSSECNGGELCGLEIYAGPANRSFTIRCSTASGGTTEGIVIENFEIVDESDRGDYSVMIRRPDVTLRDGIIDVRNSRRDAIGGTHEPDLEDVIIRD